MKTITIKATPIFDKIAATKKRYCINQGGTRSSKTYSLMQWAYVLAHQQSNKTISIVSETMPHLRRGAMKDFFDFLKNNNLYDPRAHHETNNTYKVGKSVIEFFSVDTPDKVHGPGRDYLFVNEIQNLKYETFFHLAQRTNEQIFADYNPTHDFWIFKKYLDEPAYKNDIEYIHSTIFDNPFVSQSIKKDVLIRAERDENYRKVYLLGEKGTLEGLIFPKITICDSMPVGNYTYGLDFGFSPDPTCLVKTLIQGENLYIQEILYRTELTGSDLVNSLPGLGLRKSYDEIFADGSRPEIISELVRNRYNCKPATKGEGSVKYGIDLMKRYNIHVTKESVNTIREFRNYQWIKTIDGDYTGKPMDAFNHSIDAIRYSLEKLKQNRNGRIKATC